MLENPLVSMLSLIALMAGVVLAFRLYVRKPKGRTVNDPRGVRTVVAFSGNDPEFFADDREQEMFVGVRLFQSLLGGLAERGVAIESQGPVDNAQGAVCGVAGEQYRLVLEWVDERWVAGVEWHPRSRAVQRHLTMTHEVYAPSDSPALRSLLTALDGWIKGHAGLGNVAWYRKQDWLHEDLSQPADAPIDPAEVQRG
jgi:hypothetical protein